MLTDKEMKYALKLKTEQLYEKGCAILGLNCDDNFLPTVVFKKWGGVAGTADIQGNEIDYNMDIVRQNYDNFMQRTPAHEVAHLLACRKFGWRISAHGKEWKYVMRTAFQLDPARCHNYDMTGVKRKGGTQARYNYVCDCNKHSLSKRSHNANREAIRQGFDGKYRCKDCKQIIQYKP